MAQYDPLELAAYLRRARDPVSGFQPSFTDRDIHNQYDFDVRSPEEVALGAHIDPITGLPVGEEVKPSIESKIVSTTAEWKDLGEYKTTADLIQHELDLIKQQKNLVDSTIKEVEDARGVTLARKNLADYAALATDPTDPIYQQLENQLALRSKAAAIDFTLTDKGGLRGTKAQAFKVFDERFKQLEARKLLVAKDEAKLEELKQREALATINEKFDIRRDQRRKQEDVEEKEKTIAAQLKINTDELQKIKAIRTDLNKSTSWNDLAAMKPAEAAMYKAAVKGELTNKLADIVTVDSTLADTYIDITKKLKSNPQEIQLIENVARKYKDVLLPIDQMSDRALVENNAELKKTYNNISIPNDQKQVAIDAERYKLKLKALDEANLNIVATWMTTDSMELDSRPDIGIDTKQSANLVLQLIKENTGASHLINLSKDPEAIDYLKTQLVIDYYNAGHNLTFTPMPLLPLWDIMLAEATNKATILGSPMGLVTSYKSDPIIISLRKNAPRVPRTMGEMSIAP
ncbi:MAG: hypothetical protein KIS69_10360 [Bacteroidetes bacterium]|nr:hypothetical protein [Bacteroidota bacterium]